MKKLDGKIALITGSSRGLGKAIAKELAAAGAIILLHASHESSTTQETYKEIQRVSSKTTIYYADLEHTDEIFTMTESIKKQFPYINILVNNAGITKSNTFLDMTNEQWDNVIKINLSGVFYMTKAVVPLMLHKKDGRIINMASIYGLIGEYGLTNYCASKAGIIGFTKALSKEMATHSITVNAICPGLTDTGMISDIPQKQLEHRLKQIPLARIGKKEEVAKLVAFLCSSEAGYITGQAISINGGML